MDYKQKALDQLKLNWRETTREAKFFMAGAWFGVIFHIVAVWLADYKAYCEIVGV